MRRVWDVGEGWQINLISCTQVLLNEIEQGISQHGVALTYAMAMKSDFEDADKPDWQVINLAIVGRWKHAGLTRVKNRAWRIYRGEIKP